MGPLAGPEVAPLPDSVLALSVLRLEPGHKITCADPTNDSLLYVFSGDGSLELGEKHDLAAGTAGLVLAGEEAAITAGATGMALVHATAGPDSDRHAPLGAREAVVPLDAAPSAGATGARSFQILLGPHTGSVRATLFVGFIPPGKAPWHYHLYDEIVFVPEDPAKLHLDAAIEEVEAGLAFRLRPRQVHIVENPSSAHPLTVVGIFSPAGSPSAAYLTQDVAESYRFSA
jgi:quercetin dioxygenase-like cupin family protein